MSGVDDLAGLLGAYTGPRYDTGTVVRLVDVAHVQVDLGERVVTAAVPGTLAGAAAEGSFVRVVIQDNNPVLDSVINGAVAGTVPVGSVVLWASAAAPDGWLLCQGQSFVAADYPQLAAVLGGTTVPDLRGRVPVGRAASGTFGSLGATGGAETHQLTVAQMPTHQHTYGDSRAASQASTGTNPVHGTAFNNSNYNTSFSGGNEAHNNLQPYRVINFIIKAR